MKEYLSFLAKNMLADQQLFVWFRVVTTGQVVHVEQHLCCMLTDGWL